MNPEETAEDFILAEEESPSDVEETPEVGTVAEPAPVETVDPKQAAYDYFRQNPDEHRALLKAAEAIYTPAPAPAAGNDDPFPDWEDPKFQDYTQYNRAVAEWTQRSVQKQMSEQMAAVRGAYDPIVGPQAVQSAVSRIVSTHGVPDEGRGYLEKHLAGLPAAALSQIDPQTSEILAMAAKGYAMEQAGKVGTNGRVRHAEPVAGVGPTRLELAEGVTRADLNAYLSVTGKTLNKETVSELRQGGYLK